MICDIGNATLLAVTKQVQLSHVLKEFPAINSILYNATIQLQCVRGRSQYGHLQQHCVRGLTGSPSYCVQLVRAWWFN